MLSVHSLQVRYADKTIVRDLSFSVKQGEVVSIIGPNGSGKSTILKAMSRMIPCQAGRVCIANREIQSLSTKQVSRMMCMLCQSNSSPTDMTVKELVSYGRLPHKKWYERLSADDLEIVDWALERTGLLDYRDRLVISLSGGEAQRAWLAMALAQRPKVLLLDEPTTYLDIAHQMEVLELIKHLNQELNLTVVMVLHDLNHASRYSDRVCVIHHGSIRAFGKPEEVFTQDMIRAVYGVDTEIQYVEGTSKPRIHILNKYSMKKAGEIHEDTRYDQNEAAIC